ncbi:MAG: hypothetical protein AB1449_06015 [Chloroflexota bacterium]
MAWIRDSLKYLVKAYLGGCFGCLGASSAMIALLVVAVLVLGPRAAGALQQFPGLLGPILSESGCAQGGPAVAPGTSHAPAATPTGALPQLEMWLTEVENPDAPASTTLEFGDATPAHTWVRGPRGASVSFDLWMT